MNEGREPVETLLAAAEAGLRVLREVRGETKGDSSAKARDPPLRASWLEEAQSVQFTYTTKYACGFAWYVTSGFIINREPNSDPGIVRWSAPCFISGSLGGLGPLFGATRTESVTLGMAQTVVNRFVQRGRRITGGMDWSFVAGSSRAVHSDIVTAPLSTWGVISVDSASGAIIGTGLLAGIIEVRKDINESHYGPVSTADILLGKVPPPPELAPLYEELTRIVLEQTNDGGGVPAGDLASKRILSAVEPDTRLLMSDGKMLLGSDVTSVTPEYFAKQHNDRYHAAADQADLASRAELGGF